MAKKQSNGFSKFDLNESDMVGGIDKIYDAPSASSTEQAQVQHLPDVQPTEAQPHEAPQVAQEPLSRKDGKIGGLKPLKAEKGVKIMLPMDYYFKLVQIKACTGKTLQELAAQGVMEFIENFKQE